MMELFQVYPMPMVYGGFGGYGYNPQWGYSVPVMPSPSTVEEGKQTAIMPGQMSYDSFQEIIFFTYVSFCLKL